MDSSLSIYFVSCEALSLSCHTLLYTYIPTKITVAMGLVQRKGSSKSIHLKCQPIILVDNIFSVIRLDSLFGLNLRLDVCAFSWFTAIDSNNENSIKTCTCWHHNYWDRFRKHERTICVMKIHTTWTLYRLSADPDISGGKMSLQQIKHILCLARSPPQTLLPLWHPPFAHKHIHCY